MSSIILQAVNLLDKEDSFAAIEHLTQQSDDPVIIAKNFSELVRYLYWEAKDIWGVITIGRAGIQFGLSHKRPKIRGVAKTIAYNVASYTWDGWQETGIVITPTILNIGLDAARANLRLAEELERDDLVKSRAQWMIGAHLLSIKEKERAKNRFYQAALLASAAEKEDEAMLARAFAAIAKHDADELYDLKSRLAEKPDNKPFLSQIRKAQRVYKFITPDLEETRSD